MKPTTSICIRTSRFLTDDLLRTFQRQDQADGQRERIDSRAQAGRLGQGRAMPSRSANPTPLAMRTVLEHAITEGCVIASGGEAQDKKEIDPKGIPQFGLVAEEVAKVNADLVITGRDRKSYTVRYDAVNAVLLNEFLKEHKKVQEQGVKVTQQRKDLQAVIARQQKQIAALTAGLQNVSAQLQVRKPAAQTVLNNQ